MPTYEVEVVGHFAATIEIEAENEYEAEELALAKFEQDYKPYSVNDGWTDSWGDSEVEMTSLIYGGVL
jgi:hypothetical protein